MLLIEGLRSLQRPTYLQTPIGGHHHQLRSLDLVGQLTSSESEGGRGRRERERARAGRGGETVRAVVGRAAAHCGSR